MLESQLIPGISFYDLARSGQTLLSVAHSRTGGTEAFQRTKRAELKLPARKSGARIGMCKKSPVAFLPDSMKHRRTERIMSYMARAG